MWGFCIVTGIMYYSLCKSYESKNKNKDVEIINNLLKQKLIIKNKEIEVYPYVKSYFKNKKEVFIIDLPIGFEFKQLVDLKGIIENAIKKPVIIQKDNFNYSIIVSNETEIPKVVPFKLIDTTQEKGIKIAIGTTGEEIVYLDFQTLPHVLVGGATGWGKSIFTKGLILQIIHNYPTCELELLDFKAGVELKDFQNLKQTKSFIVRPYEAEKELKRIYNEIEDRFDEINKADVRDIIEYNKKNKQKMCLKFIIIEEFTVLLDQSKDISLTLTKSLAIARAVGVYFIFTSQRFSADIIDPKIKANIDNRVCFHVADSTNSKIILDKVGAEQLKNVGRFLISKGGELLEAQSFYVKSEDIKKIIKNHIKPVSIEEKVSENISLENGGGSLWV